MPPQTRGGGRIGKIPIRRSVRVSKEEAGSVACGIEVPPPRRNARLMNSQEEGVLANGSEEKPLLVINREATEVRGETSPPRQSPVTDVPPPHQSPVADVLPPRQSPVADVPSPRQSPVADVPPPRQSPVADVPPLRQSPVADVLPPLAEVPPSLAEVSPPRRSKRLRNT